MGQHLGGTKSPVPGVFVRSAIASKRIADERSTRTDPRYGRIGRRTALVVIADGTTGVAELSKRDSGHDHRKLHPLAIGPDEPHAASKSMITGIRCRKAIADI